MNNDAALSIHEAAEALGIGRSTLYGLIKRRRLAARKLGKRTLILKTDLAAFMSTLPSTYDG